MRPITSFADEALPKLAFLNTLPKDSFGVRSAKVVSATITKLALATLALLATSFYAICTVGALPFSYFNQKCKKHYLALKAHTLVSARGCFQALRSIGDPSGKKMVFKNPAFQIETTLRGKIGKLLLSQAQNAAALSILGLSLYLFEQKELTIEHLIENPVSYFGMMGIALGAIALNGHLLSTIAEDMEFQISPDAFAIDPKKIAKSLFISHACMASSYFGGNYGFAACGAAMMAISGIPSAVSTIRFLKQTPPLLFPPFNFFTFDFYKYMARETALGFAQRAIAGTIQLLGTYLHLTGSKIKGTPYSLLDLQRMQVQKSI